VWLELTVIVDPATNARVVHRRQALQGLIAAVMKRPAPDGRAIQRRCTRRRHEAMCVDMTLPDRRPCPECEPEKVERLVREIAAPVCILAVDDLRLLGVQDQLAGRKAIRKRAPQCLRLVGAFAVTDDVVRVSLKWNVRKVRAIHLSNA
jgi:hypothetical protein